MQLDPTEPMLKVPGSERLKLKYDETRSIVAYGFNLGRYIQAICAKYGVPYVQESVWKRVGQLADNMVGKKSMLVWENGD